MYTEMLAGRGLIYLRTPEAIENLSGDDPTKGRQIIDEAWEDFLDMTISQSVLWAARKIAPEEKPSEVVLAGPYLIGSHSGESGAWISGPEDVAPPQYHWGYNKMTTVSGLFAAGDGVRASPHRFSSGSFTEGRLAGKAAVAYAFEQSRPPTVDEGAVEALKKQIWQPLATFDEY